MVDAALDLIDGEFVDLVVEAVGDEAAGVEFFRTNSSGTREYHSIKRQQADGNWTISRLAQGKPPSGRSILGDLVQKIQEGAVGVFSSGTSASELVNLLESALPSESHEGFQARIRGNARLSGCFYKTIVPICGNAEAAYFALRHLRVRTKLESDLAKDIERRIRSIFRMQTGAPPDTTAVRLLIADFATSKLAARLTGDSFLSDLRGHGILLSPLSEDGTAGTQVQKLNRMYLREVDALLINRAEIKREESAAAYSSLLDHGKSVMLEGTAGGGKSCVVAQVVKQLDSHDIPTLVIRLDRLTEADHSAQAVGVRRELPDSPTITLGELAGDQPSVLCIDQLDALSIVSARQQSAWNALDELLDEARNYPNMRILFACRSFDLAQIHRRDDYAAAELAIGGREGDGPGTIWGRGGPVSVFSCRGETLRPSANVGQGEIAGRGRSKRHSQTGLARVRGDVRLAGWRPVAAAAVRQGVAGRAIGPGHDRTGLPKASAVADAV